MLKLLSKLFPIIADRIWSYLPKLSLFTHDGKEGLASRIFGAVEMVNGDFRFSLNLVEFANALIRDCIKLPTTFNKPREGVIYQIVSHLVFLFENFSHCHFARVYDKFKLGSSILDFLTTVLTTTFGVEKDCVPEKSSQGCLPLEASIY